MFALSSLIKMMNMDCSDIKINFGRHFMLIVLAVSPVCKSFHVLHSMLAEEKQKTMKAERNREIVCNAPWKCETSGICISGSTWHGTQFILFYNRHTFSCHLILDKCRLFSRLDKKRLICLSEEVMLCSGQKRRNSQCASINNGRVGYCISF